MPSCLGAASSCRSYSGRLHEGCAMRHRRCTLGRGQKSGCWWQPLQLWCRTSCSLRTDSTLATTARQVALWLSVHVHRFRARSGCQSVKICNQIGANLACHTLATRAPNLPSGGLLCACLTLYSLVSAQARYQKPTVPLTAFRFFLAQFEPSNDARHARCQPLDPPQCGCCGAHRHLSAC